MPKDQTSAQIPKTPESGGVVSWVKNLFSSDKSQATPSTEEMFYGRGAELTPEEKAARVEADRRMQEAIERAKKAGTEDLTVMRGGPNIAKLIASVGASMFGTAPTPSDIKGMMLAWQERDGIAKFHQSAFIGMDHPEGEKIASMIGLGRVLNSALSHGEITKHEAAALLHEGMVSITGHVVGRESWWQRMIGAGVHAAADPIEHAAIHQMEHQEHNITLLKEKLKSMDLKSIPGNVETKMYALLDEIQETGKISLKSNEAYASADAHAVTPPPSTPKAAPLPTHVAPKKEVSALS